MILMNMLFPIDLCLRTSVIRNTIIDKNARIGDNVRIDPADKNHNYAKGGIVVKDGIAVVVKNTTIPDGFKF